VNDLEETNWEGLPEELLFYIKKYSCRQQIDSPLDVLISAVACFQARGDARTTLLNQAQLQGEAEF